MPDGPGRSWRKRALVAGAVFSAVLAALVAVGNLWVLSESKDKILTAADTAPARPYVIVLGNMVLPDGRPAPELSERLQTGYALYRAGRASRVIVSGRVREGYDEPRAMANWLEARGVPAADIVLDGGGHRTAATMADAAALGVKAALVATQAYHLPRALYLARHAGIDAIGVPATRNRRSTWQNMQTQLREILARAETIIEVALRGVRP